MKWFLVKLLFTVFGGIPGALICGNPLGGIFTMPFGWILGKAIELRCQVRRLGPGEIEEDDKFEQDASSFDDDLFREPFSYELYHDPLYAGISGNIYNTDED